MPAGVDPIFFNIAPADQCTETLRQSQLIVLENLHPEHPKLVTTLVEVSPEALIDRPVLPKRPLISRQTHYGSTPIAVYAYSPKSLEGMLKIRPQALKMPVDTGTLTLPNTLAEELDEGAEVLEIRDSVQDLKILPPPANSSSALQNQVSLPKLPPPPRPSCRYHPSPS